MKVSEAGGRPPMPLGRMWHRYFLPAGFNVSDPAVEEALCDSAGCARLPRWTWAAKLPRMRTRCARFRHLLERQLLG
jgi:hypothetical protein